MSLADYLELQKLERLKIEGRNHSPSRPMTQAERNRGPHGRVIAEAIGKGQISHEEGQRRIEKYWDDARQEQSEWDAETQRRLSKSSDEISQIKAFIEESSRTSVDSSAWTGRAPTKSQIVAVRSLAPEARDSLAKVIGEGRINDPEVIESLQVLHDLLGNLADASNDEASLPGVYIIAKEKFSSIRNTLDSAFWRATSSPMSTIGILFIVGMIFGVSWANLVGNSLMTHAVKEKGSKELK